MTQHEVEDFMNAWMDGDEKGFKYYDYGLSVEYVVIKKEGYVYSIIRSKSTCYEKPFTKDWMEKMLGSNRLVPFNNGSWSPDFKGYKAEGCQCGAAFTLNPTCHSYWCPKYVKN